MCGQSRERALLVDPDVDGVAARELPGGQFGVVSARPRDLGHARHLGQGVARRMALVAGDENVAVAHRWRAWRVGHRRHSGGA
jgi:hypothetical protein